MNAGDSVNPDDVELARVVEAYAEAREKGLPVDAERLVAEHPGIAERLRKCLASLEAVEGAAGRLTPGVLGCLGDFRLLREVGRGGMGVVYEAEQISLGRRVALKVLPFAAMMDSKHLQRFHNEARAAASLEHPHIVPVYAVGSERGVHFYAMKFIDGRTLAEVIAEQCGSSAAPLAASGDGAVVGQVANDVALYFSESMRAEHGRGMPVATKGATGPTGPASAAPDPPESQNRRLPLTGRSEASDTAPIAAAATLAEPRDTAYYQQVAGWGVQAALALEHAHSLGIVHRDIKPANLLIDGRGELWVADFGLARTVNDAGLTMSRDVVGTLRYMSPEQALAKHDLVDHRADVYSLGVTLYELLALAPAFAGLDRQELLRQIAFEEPQRLRQADGRIPEDLETVVAKAMAKEPCDRYATAQELADDLRRFGEDRPIRARRPGPGARLSRWVRRHFALVLTSVIMLLVCGLGTIVGLSLLLVERSRTEAARTEAAEQRVFAEERARAVRDRQYGEDVRQAHRAWKLGHREQLRQLLERNRPAPGEEDLRGFEWDYLWRLSQDGSRTLRGHQGAVHHAEFSPDGQTVASAGADRAVMLWDATTGGVTNLVGHSAEVNWVTYSPDGRTLASASDDTTVRLWDVTSKRCQRIFKGHTAAVVVAVYSPDGKTVASGGEDKVVRFWDTETGVERFQIGGLTGRIESLAYAPDGNSLAIAGGFKSTAVWDLETRRPRLTVECSAVSVAYSRTSQLVGIGTHDARVLLIDAENCRHVRTLVGVRDRVESLAFSPDTRTLLTGMRDGTVQCWDLSQGVQLWSANGHSGPVWCAAYAPDGTQVVSTSSDRTVKLRDLDTHSDRLFPHERFAPMNILAFSPAGELLYPGWDGNSVRKQRFGSTPIADLPPPTHQFKHGQYSADAKYLVLQTAEGMRIWDCLADRWLHGLWGTAVVNVTISSGNKRFALVQPGVGIYLHETATDKLLEQFRDPDCIGPVAFSPDGRRLAWSAKNHRIRVRELETGQSYDFEDGDPSYGTGVLTFSPDGRSLALFSGNAVRVRDSFTGGLLIPELRHFHRVACAQFSPDGKRLATAGEDGTVRLWSMRTGEELLVLDDLFGRVGVLAFSPDGTTLAALTVREKTPRVCIERWSTSAARK